VKLRCTCGQFRYTNTRKSHLMGRLCGYSCGRI
jgi:hypothetical protein